MIWFYDVSLEGVQKAMASEKKPRAGKKKPALKKEGSASARDMPVPAMEKESLCEPALTISQLLDFLPDPTFAIDLKGTVIIWNRAMEKLTGVSADKMLGKSDHEYSLPIYGTRRPVLVDLVLHPGFDIEKTYTSLLRQEEGIYAETTGLPLKRHLWIKASPLCDKTGQVIGAIETLRDITDSKLTESALKKSEAKYRDFFTNVSDYLYLHDLEGNFIETNLATKKGSGYTEAEISNLSVKDLLPERHRHRFQNYIQNVLSKGTDEGFLTIKNKFGIERVLEYRNSLVTDQEGKPAAVRGSAAT
jgi:PAS domain S-box-containing protein